MQSTIYTLNNQQGHVSHALKLNGVAIMLFPSAAAAATYLHKVRKLLEAVSFPTGPENQPLSNTDIDQPVQINQSRPEILCLDSYVTLTLELSWLSKPAQSH